MSGARVFFDTNVLLYLLSEESAKADRAEQTLAQGGFISVQGRAFDGGEPRSGPTTG